VGTPAASGLTLAPGAGHGGEGDASFQGPAQETDQAQIDALPAQPKPTQELPAQVDIDAANAALSSVIELKARKNTKPHAVETSAAPREAGGLVTVRAKPEKRKNAQQRAKERNEERNKDRTEVADVAAVVPEVGGLSTAHPKPEKRKNAKERAKAKFAKDKDAKEDTTADGTRPMTATAKFKVDAKAEAKANAKAERKVAAKAKKAKSAARKAA
jgi:hypothetical protein